MFTTTCKLTKGDREVIATVNTTSPQESGAVDYVGDMELIPQRHARLRNADLRAVFAGLAGEIGAYLDVLEFGEYESWAE